MKIYYLPLLLTFVCCGQKIEIRNTNTNIYLPQVVDANFKSIKRNRMFERSNLNADSIIKGLNLVYPKVHLEKNKQTNDTLYTFIRDSYYLGERMGSTGVDAYLANVVFNITAISNIHFISISLEEGSHISSGVWSSKDFKDYKHLP